MIQHLSPRSSFHKERTYCFGHSKLSESRAAELIWGGLCLWLQSTGSPYLFSAIHHCRRRSFPLQRSQMAGQETATGSRRQLAGSNVSKLCITTYGTSYGCKSWRFGTGVGGGWFCLENQGYRSTWAWATDCNQKMMVWTTFQARPSSDIPVGPSSQRSREQPEWTTSIASGWDQTRWTCFCSEKRDSTFFFFNSTQNDKRWN